MSDIGDLPVCISFNLQYYVSVCGGKYPVLWIAADHRDDRAADLRPDKEADASCGRNRNFGRDSLWQRSFLCPDPGNSEIAGNPRRKDRRD